MDLENQSPVRRQFGCYEIFWEIENYFSATSKKNWTVHSPEFTVRNPEVTQWRFFIKTKPKEENYAVCMYLERLESDPFPDSIRVTWKFSYPGGNIDNFTSELASVFQKKTAIRAEIYGIDEIEKQMRYTNCSTFIVRCRMIVYKVERIRNSLPDDPGLKSLSQDFSVLRKFGRFYDLKLLLGQDISAHRAVLSSRNHALDFEIRDLKDNDEFDLTWAKLEVAVALIDFLYTGNLDYILRRPSFEMIHLINYLNVKELKGYFEEDRLTLRTSFERQEFDFKWMTPNIFDTKVDSFLSPCWWLESLNTTLQLSLHLRGIDTKSDHVALFCHFAMADRPKEAYIECGIEGGIEKHHALSSFWILEAGQLFGFKKFISRDDLNTLLTEGSLIIVCKLGIPSGAEKNLTVTSKMGSVVKYKKNEHFENLSKDLRTLLETGAYSDITVEAGSVKYKVHRDILSVRSHVFRKIIGKALPKTTVTVLGISPDILKIVLHYTYTGKLKMDNLKYVFSTYDAALKFHILPLKYACSELLRDRMCADNIEEILSLANKGKDFKLRTSALQYVAILKQGMPQVHWLHFMKENSISERDVEYITTFTDKRLT